MKQHLDLLDNILTRGVERVNDRTGLKTISLFGPQMEFDLSEGFPLVTTRSVNIKPVAAELMWFLSGSTNAKDLNALGAKVWDSWALKPEHLPHPAPTSQPGWFARWFQYISDPDSLSPKDIYEEGDLGPIYGEMLRAWPGPDGETYDQIQYILDTLKSDPYSRRLVVSCWNPAFLPSESISSQMNVLNGKQALAPCHTLFQFFVEPVSFDERCKLAGVTYDMFESSFNMVARAANDAVSDIPKYRLSCKLYARSQDVPVGTVFNQAMYPMLTLMLCQQFNMLPGRYIHTMGDAHIYENQISLVKEQLKRQPRTLPKLAIVKRDSIFDHVPTDFSLEGYNPDASIRFPIAI